MNTSFGLEAIEYNILNNKYGVRKPSEIFNPRLVSVLDFPGLPYSSILHYLGAGVGDLGPKHDTLFFRKINVPVMVSHITTLNSTRGNPIKVAMNPQGYIREYHKKEYRMRPLKKWDSIIYDKKTPIVVNYAIAAYSVRYTNNFLTGYNRWYNTQHTLWSTVNELANRYERHHFIHIELPSEPLMLNDLLRAENMVDTNNSGSDIGTESWHVNDDFTFDGQMGLEAYKEVCTSVGLEELTRSMLENFSENSALTLLDIWLWMGEDRSKSLLSLLSDNVLSKINLIFLQAGKLCFINLKMLDSVRGRSDKLERNQLRPKQAKHLFLKFINKIQFLEPIANEIENTEDTESLITREISVNDEGEIIEEELSLSDSDITPDMIEDLENDLEQPIETAKVDKSISFNHITPKTPDDVIKKQINTLADSGAISAQEYKRLLDISENYKKLPSPDDNMTLEEYISIPKELELLPKNCKLPFKPIGLLDKSALGNTLQVMQKQYLSKVMKRQVSACLINGLQLQGLTVQKYNVEPIRSLFDEYDLHTVSVTPVKGSPSTIRIKVPHIRENGTYIFNGITNRLNPQRGDLPIRKISSTEVMLSSYYCGKILVTKSERSAFNDDKWVLNNISKKGFDIKDDSITQLKLFNSFNPRIKLPTIYSVMSTRFLSFVAGDYSLFWNNEKIKENFTEEEIQQFQNNDQILVGRNNSGIPIVVDFSNNFWLCTAENLTPIGTIETVLGFNDMTSPVGLVEIDILNTLFPLGLVLGFYLGLDNLLALLKPEVVRTKQIGNSKVTVLDHEFSVTFNDEVLVFTKGNKLVEYIFNGFNRWPKDLKRYNSTLFNKPEVYTAIWERNGISARYIRELNNIFTTFIDPITKSNLERINEPTDMLNLFIRATELLTTKDYPAISNARYSRDKGYERIAGLVYSEVARAGRIFKSKTSPMAKFEINPMSVLMGVIQDGANSLVEDSNPIHNMKESEIVVFGGTGGRSQRSMQGNHRGYDDSQLGTTSEATKDSGKVATIVYTSQDPKYDTIYGTSLPYDEEEDGPARLLSGSVMLAPASDRED